MDGSNMKRTIEALLIATEAPLTLPKIIEITNLQKDEIVNCVKELKIYTLPEFALWVGALHDRKSRLSKAALETLAIIAYHQPITRPEIEKVRGVDSTYMLDALLQKNLIKTCGRLPLPGRPIRYGTTKEFLRYFGIKDLGDLPREEDFGEAIAIMENTGAQASSDEHRPEPSPEEPEEETAEDKGTEEEIVKDEPDESFLI